MPIGQVGTCSWSLQPDGPAGLIELVQATGVDRLQLALTPLVSDPGTWSGTIEQLHAEGIEVLSGMMQPLDEDYSSLESIARTGGVRPDATWEGNVEMARQIAALASKYGIGLVTLHAGFMPEDQQDPEHARLIERLGILADVFIDQGVGLGFETGQETAGTLLEVLDALDRDEVGVNFDPANMILYGKGDPIDALEQLAPHVVQLHIKDATPAASPGDWGSEVPAGTGAVDWDAFFRVAAELPGAVHAIIEREAGDERIEDIRTAAALVQGATR